MKTSARPFVLYLLAMVWLGLAGAPAGAQNTANIARDGLSESMYRVTLKRGVDLNLLVNQRTGSSPTIAVLLFAGYPGILKLREEGGALEVLVLPEGVQP